MLRAGEKPGMIYQSQKPPFDSWLGIDFEEMDKGWTIPVKIY